MKIGWLLRNFHCRRPDFMKFLWLNYIQPKIYYWSQLYSPSSGPQLARLENLLRSFTKKVEGLQSTKYWDLLKSLQLSSINRRFERYKCLYAWKILNNKVDNCNLQLEHTDKSGYSFLTNKVGKYFVQNRTQSFQWIGPRLYNALPRYLRDFKPEFSEFKPLFNEFLA